MSSGLDQAEDKGGATDAAGMAESSFQQFDTFLNKISISIPTILQFPK